MAVKRDCLVCGGEFEPRANQLKAGVGFYCSQRCSGVAKTEGLAERFWRFVQAGDVDQCWTWTGATIERGYGQMRGRGKSELAHRIAYQLFNGPIPADAPFILHTCDNPACVNPAHLEAGTHDQNMLEAVERGRFLRGDNHPSSKLTIDDVLAIRDDGRCHRLIAADYSVSQGAISHIKRRSTWAHL